MDIFQSLIAGRLIFVLGIINLVTAILVFGSCRCLPGLRIADRLIRYPSYRRFFKLHCYIWWIFWVSVVVHAFFALMFFGWPG